MLVNEGVIDILINTGPASKRLARKSALALTQDRPLGSERGIRGTSALN
jgi:hypothetical protein